MNKNVLAVTLLSLLTLSAFVPFAMAHNPGAWTNPMVYELDVTGNPGSLDPAYAYDSVSSDVIMNVYETLLFFDPLWTLGPYQPIPPAPQRASTFIPQLATMVPTVANGLIDHAGGTNPVSGLHWYSKFTFPIRAGVKFHHGPFADPDGAGPLMGSIGILTPRDVEYSIERVLVQDRVGGPAWLLYEPLLNEEEAVDPITDPSFGIKIDGAVQVSGNNVVLYLAGQYPDLGFEQILCQTWSSVVSEAWAANEGDLNMNLVTPIPPSTNPWSNWDYIYNRWHAPRPSFLEDAIDNADPMKDGGTGPYRMSYWTRGTAWSIVRFPDYVAPNENLGRAQSWPAPVSGSTAPLGGYLDTVTWYLVVNWPTRLSQLLAGSRDTVAVPRIYRDPVLGQIVGGEPIRCYYPFDLLASSALFFTFDISNAAVPWYVPSLLPDDTFGTTGIPRNIFGTHSVTSVDEGLNVRRGFAYAFNYLRYLNEEYLGEGYQPADPVIDGLAYNRLRNTEDETWEKHNELTVDGVYTAGESIYRDNDDSFTVSAGDILIQGPTLPVGTQLISFNITLFKDEKHTEDQDQDGWYNGEEAKYADNNGNGDWDGIESAIRDNDNSGFFDPAIDTVLCGVAPPTGTALSWPDDFEKYADLLFEWDVNEPSIMDNDNDGYFDPEVDTVLVGIAPPVNTILRVPDDFETYAESVIVNGQWDISEPAIRDNDNNGIFDSSIDTVLCGDPPLDGTVLVTPVGLERHADIMNEWDPNEPSIRDGNNNGAYDASDTVLIGMAPLIGTILQVPDDLERYADINFSNEWDISEPAIRDSNDNSLYDASDTALVGVAPALGSVLEIPDDFETYAETVTVNCKWDTSEPAIRDNDNNGLFDPAIDTLLVGIAPSVGEVLRNPVRESIYRDLDHDGTVSAGDIHVAGPVQPLGLPLVSFVGRWKHVYNPSLTRYCLKLAWGGVDANSNGIIDPINELGDLEGALWTGGMRFVTVWPTGVRSYMLAQQRMNAEINTMNPSKFFLTNTDVDWGTVFLPDMAENKLPVFMCSWTADSTDPHDFVHPFMHSQGTLGTSQMISITVTASGLRQVFVDELIEQGIATPDTPAAFTQPAGSIVADWFDEDKSGTLNTGDWAQIGGAWYERQSDGSYMYDRQMIYYELQESYFEEVPSTTLIQPIGRHWEVAWVRGWYHNPLYGGSLTPDLDSSAPTSPVIYAYHVWKAKTHFGDTNWDGLVGGVDRSVISSHWGGPPKGIGGYNPRADINGGTGATIGSASGPVKGIPDGKVNMADLALVSAYWDIPLGPSHP